MPESHPAARPLPALVVVRHGETEWSRSGRHTGRSDLPLTAAGERQAVATGAVLHALLGNRAPALVLSSPRQRARRTAELAGYPPDELTEDAAEWDYGELEGLTSAEIGERYPDWSIWTGPVPGGEDADAVSTRIDRLLQRVAEAGGPVLVFSHGHASRCLAARWLGEPVSSGQHYRLDTGGIGVLGFEHDWPVILQWNIDSRANADDQTSTAGGQTMSETLIEDAASTDVVELTVPADPAYIAVLRAVTASLSARRDFTLDEIDDLRIAVDEACALLLPHAQPASPLWAVFGGTGDQLEAQVSIELTDRDAVLDETSFAWMVLTALTDSVTSAAADGRLALTFTKARGARN